MNGIGGWVIRHWIWSFLFGGFPIMLSTIVIELTVSNELIHTLRGRLKYDTNPTPKILEEILKITGYTVLYIVVCLLFACYFWREINDISLKKSMKDHCMRYLVILPTAIVFFFVSLLTLYCNPNPLELKIVYIVHDSITEVYNRSTQIVTESMNRSLFDTCITPRTLLVYPAWFIGLTAAIVGASNAVIVSISVIEHNTDAQDARKKLLRSTMAMSAVLVASVLLVEFSFHMHSALYVSGTNGYLSFDALANSLSVFCGVILTATLIAIYTPQLFILQLIARHRGDPQPRPVISEEAKVVLSILGPLLAGIAPVLVRGLLSGDPPN